MKIRHEGTEKVTYTQWGERLAGFMNNPNRITSNNQPENKDSYPRIDIDIFSVIDGFEAKVRYYQTFNPNEELTKVQRDQQLEIILIKANHENVLINSGIELTNEANHQINQDNPGEDSIVPINLVELLTIDQVSLPIVPFKTRLIFSYPYKSNLEKTHAMLTAEGDNPEVKDLKGLELVRGLLKIMVMADILENNVFGLTKE